MRNELKYINNTVFVLILCLVWVIGLSPFKVFVEFGVELDFLLGEDLGKSLFKESRWAGDLKSGKADELLLLPHGVLFAQGVLLQAGDPSLKCPDICLICFGVKTLNSRLSIKLTNSAY